MSNDATPTNQTCPRILLAEDSDDDAFFFERAVRKSGVQCSFVRARNGKIATELLQGAADKSELIDVVFLDLKMPVMSGFEVLEWLRSANLPGAPKVIVLSGSNEHGDRIRAMELGAIDYIVKPIAGPVLRERISQLNNPEIGARA